MTKLPRSFHKCSGVLCGLEKAVRKSQSSGNDNNADWCKLCKATCPAKDNNEMRSIYFP